MEKEYERHYEEIIKVGGRVEEVFKTADEFANFSGHMNQSSLMMGGGKMVTKIDGGQGKKVGSRIKLYGKVWGLQLFLEEVVTLRNPPFKKEWQTTGNIHLAAIDHYRLGFEIRGNSFRVYIDYNLPKSGWEKIAGSILGEYYARWCVGQMMMAVKHRFS